MFSLLNNIAQGVSNAVRTQAVQIQAESTKDLSADITRSAFVEDYYSRVMPTVGNTEVQNFALVKAAIEELKKTNPDNLDALYSFNGFGPIRNIFDESKPNHKSRREWLEKNLSAQELQEAKQATLTSFYTPISISTAIWDGLKNSGFDGGRIADPAVGTGRLIAPIEPQLKTDSDITLIELDPTSYKVAQALYPNTEIHNSEYQDVKLPLQDVIVSNPPFNSVRTSDRTGLSLSGLKLHTFFVMKSLNCLREQGTATFILPTSFMDEANSKDRTEVSKLANLVSAVRVPFELFESSSNTKMAVDVLTFQRSDKPTLAPLWVDTIESTCGNSYYTHNAALDTEFTNLAVPVEAFLFNKQQVLWEAADKNNLDDQVYTAIVNSLAKFTYVPFKHEDIASLSNVSLADPKTSEPFTFNITSDDCLVFQTSDGFLEVDAKIGGIKHKRISGLIAIARIAEQLFSEEAKINANEALMSELRKSLNSTYDSFVKKCGFISNRANTLAFKRDNRFAALLALEVDFDAGITKQEAKESGIAYKAPTAKKADIFHKRAYEPWILPSEAASVEDALDLSLAFTGTVDFELIASLVSQTPKAVTSQLLGSKIFYDPQLRDYAIADVYLSGDVKSKMALAKQLEATDTRLAANIVALEAVMPKDVAFGDISVCLTSHWLPKEILEQFLIEKLGFGKTTKMSHTLGSWKPNLVGLGDTVSQVEYKTTSHDLRSILMLIFRFGEQVVKIYDDHGKVVGIDHEATAQLKSSIRNLELDFKSFIEPQAKLIEERYNEIVNRFAPFCSNYTNNIYPDLNPSFVPYNHQNAAIQRNVSAIDNGILLDAAIGSGKTAVYAISAHELVRLGLKKRIFITVPNHLVGQTSAEWLRLYPSDRNKLLVLNSKSLSPKQRLETLERIKTSNINFVIVPFSTCTKIAPPMEYVDLEVENRISELEEIKRQDSNKATVREVQNQIKRLNEQLKKIKSNYKEGNDFKSLGFDSLLVDEAHAVKNSGYSTSVLKNVKGVGTLEPSNIALDVSFKVSYLLNTFKNPGVVFGTGTSLANSLIEIYGYARMLAPNLLKAASINCLDDFVTTFVSVNEQYEVTPQGTVKLERRCSSFNNLEELAALFSSFSFTITSEELQELLPPIVDSEGNEHCAIVPMTGGKPIARECEISEEELSYMDFLVERASNYKSSPVQNDNALLLISDARKAALSPQSVNALTDTVIGSKTQMMIDDVIEQYHRADHKRLSTCQICFIDYGTPSAEKDREEEYANKLREQARLGCEESENELKIMRGVNVNLYKHIKQRLIDGGIDPREIAFTQDFQTDLQKQFLYESINNGNKRVVLSSFAKLSTGANIQKRISAIRVLSAPLTPSELAQGVGRGIRQGHELYIEAIKSLKSFSVDVVLYAMKRSLDAWNYQLLEAKTATVAAFRSGTLNGVRQITLESDTITFGEIKAAVSGMDELIELKKNERHIFDEESAYRSFLNKQSYTRYAIERIKDNLFLEKQLVVDARNDFKSLVGDRDNGNMSIFLDNVSHSQVTEKLAEKVFEKYSFIRSANLGCFSPRYNELFTFGSFSIQTVQSNKDSACFVLGPSGRKYQLNKQCHNKKLLAEAIRVIQSFKYVAQEAEKRITKHNNDIEIMSSTLDTQYDLSRLRELQAKNKELTTALAEATRAATSGQDTNIIEVDKAA